MGKDKPKKWMKLDNAAKIYPAARSREWTALFRLSAVLDQPIDWDVMEEAQRRTLRRFPGFSVRLRRGFFWYYLEQLEGAPELQEDVANPCVRMDLRENRGFMFRIRIWGRRVAVEIFHVLTDGTGGVIFLKTLVAEYLELLHGEKIPRSAEILDCSSPASETDTEDGYLRYARSATRSRSESVAYRVEGSAEDPHFMNIVTGILPADAVHAKAKEMGASVGEFLTAALIMAIYSIQRWEYSAARRSRPVKVCVPINLRKFYPTTTLRNFASYVNPGIEPRFGEYSLEETVKSVHHFMGFEVTEKMLNAKMTTNVNSERNKALRAAPLFIKKPTMKLAFKLNGDRQASSILSNLGVQKLPPEMGRHVERMDFMLGPLSLNPVTCACLTYQDRLVVNFTRTIKEPTVERNFFRSLVELGIPVEVESNQGW